jgi:pimeloyl-ACP methyl ester carboxylesterase
LPDWVTISDPVAGAGATGQIRCDRRQGPDGAHHPLLVLVGGMTQTISSWSGQLRPLSARRSVLVYEARGQGQSRLALDDCTYARHVEDFVALVAALGLLTPVDLCGFSFGGRVCLSIAASRPDLVHRLVLSGVGLERSVVGRLIVEGWTAALATGDLEALARISLADILGPAFLERNAEHIDSVIKASVRRNSYAGIKALFLGTGKSGPDWAPPALAERVQAPALCLGGAHDRLAPPHEVAALAQRLRGAHRIFPDAGHTVPIEAAIAWRAAVEGFLQ